jgi:hypothetical protein
LLKPAKFLPICLDIQNILPAKVHMKKSLTLAALLAGFGWPSVIKAAVTVNPSSFTLAAGQKLSLSVAGAPAQGVTWTISPSLGTLSGAATSATYTAPATVTQSQSVILSATAAGAPASIARVNVALLPAVTVAVNGPAPDLTSGGNETFTSTVSGAQNNAVTWSASMGTISNGYFVAPSVALDTTVTVTATSQADPTKKASYPVRVHAKSGLWFTTQANGLQSVFFNNVNFNYLYSEGMVTSVTTNTSNGTAKVTPVCTGSFTATSITKHCPTTGADSVDVTVTYSTPTPVAGVATAAGTATGTIRADIQVTNNSAVDTVSQAMLSILGVSMTQYNAASSKGQAIDLNNPIAYGNYLTGQWAIWNNAPSTDISMNVTCGWSYVCKNQPLINTIAPHQTKTASFTLRFTNDVTAPVVNLAPEAYSDFRAALPPIVNWPDRRPIMAWFTADTGHQSATNPRGYLFDPTIDASNIPAFTAKVMAQAQGILNNMKSRPVQPQGIIVWDIEGEEFIQPTTYIGDPRVFASGYAPEMNAAADSVFALFRNAGLKVGVTLRPQQMQWGTQLPSTCTYNSVNDYKDYYIMVNQPLGQKFYGCYDPNGVKWSLIPKGNGSQTVYTPNQVAQVTALLASKAAYAHSRWGATLFYVDSTVWEGGAPLPQDVFRALQAQFPDCLFIPEESNAATMGVAMPFADPKNGSAPKFAPVSWRYIYPTGALGVYLSNCAGDTTCWNTNLPNFDIGQKVGDIPIYTASMGVYPQLLNIEAMITKARTEAGTMTVTDSSSGAQFSYRGSPATVYQYPLKMRVYFAANAAGLAASTTYCETGSWLGTNTCTLNLAGLVTAQIRYYDFNDSLVISGAAQPR